MQCCQKSVDLAQYLVLLAEKEEMICFRDLDHAHATGSSLQVLFPAIHIRARRRVELLDREALFIILRRVIGLGITLGEECQDGNTDPRILSFERALANGVPGSFSRGGLSH